MSRTWGRGGRLSAAVAIALTIVLGAAVGLALAAEGDLDPNFNGGKPVVVSAGPSGSATKFTAVATQADGKIVVVGQTDTGNGSGSGTWVIERYLTSGQLDSSFGTGGVVSLTLGGTASTSGVVVQPSDQRILVGGGAISGGKLGAEFVRLKTDGSLDGSFGATGMVFVSRSGVSVTSTGGIALDSAGNAYLAGAGQDSSFTSVGLIASVSSGGAANGWATGGILLPDTSSAGPRAQLSSVAVSGGTVFYAGTARDSSPQLNPSALIGAVNASDGSAATTFGNNGLFKLSQGTAFNGLLLAADGKLKATGFGTGSGPGTGALIASFNTSGSNPTDTGFGSGGHVIVGGAANQPNNGNAITEGDGRLYAAATAVLADGSTQPAIVALDERTGALYTALGPAGFRLYPHGATGYATGIADPRSSVVLTAVAQETKGAQDEGLADRVFFQSGAQADLAANVETKGFGVNAGVAREIVDKLSTLNSADQQRETRNLAAGMNSAAGAPMARTVFDVNEPVVAIYRFSDQGPTTPALGDLFINLAPAGQHHVLVRGKPSVFYRVYLFTHSGEYLPVARVAPVNYTDPNLKNNLAGQVIDVYDPLDELTPPVLGPAGLSGQAKELPTMSADIATAAPPAQMNRIGPVGPRLARLGHVELAVVQVPGPGARSCRWLAGHSGALKSVKAIGLPRSTRRQCAPTRKTWLRASDGARWSYSLRRRLPRGRYVLYLRLVNRAGAANATFSAAKHTRVVLTVR